MAKVISMKDWVPGWVRDSYTTEAEIDALNEEHEQYQSLARDSYLTNEEIDALNEEYEQSQPRQRNAVIDPNFPLPNSIHQPLLP